MLRIRTKPATPTAVARLLFELYEEIRVDHLTPRTCLPGELEAFLGETVARSNGRLSLREAGRSVEGRPISLVSAGRAHQQVLAWTQMHGDETTATLALMDLLNFLVQSGEIPWVQDIFRNVSLLALPMLNPDGAEQRTRWNAVQIDINRDARTLASPEAQVLRAVHRRYRPAFGLNLHDQLVRSVGTSRQPVALAILAPPSDAKKGTSRTRVRAMRLGAFLVRTLHPVARGRLARYDEPHEPRAFGDAMQGWGTSTLLIEAGHWPGDTEKTFVRKLNFLALMLALYAVADGTYQDAELDFYHDLEVNGDRMMDMILRNVTLIHPSGWSHAADIGISIDVFDRNVGVIKEVGDLSTHGTLCSVDADARSLQADRVVRDARMDLQELFARLQLPRPVLGST